MALEGDRKRIDSDNTRQYVEVEFFHPTRNLMLFSM